MLGTKRQQVDSISKRKRSQVMSRVRSKDTRPEMLVRRMVFGDGYRYRLHARDLPGHPDIVFRSRRKVILVHGCFWHRHACSLARIPKSRVGFWTEKLEGNRLRDDRNRGRLARKGWRILVVWECQLSNLDRVRARIRRFLDA